MDLRKKDRICLINVCPNESNPPLGLLSIATYAEKNGYKIDIINYGLGDNIEKVSEYDIVGWGDSVTGYHRIYHDDSSPDNEARYEYESYGEYGSRNDFPSPWGDTEDTETLSIFVDYTPTGAPTRRVIVID